MIREAFLVGRVDIFLSQVATTVGLVLISHHELSGIELDAIVVLLDETFVQSGLVFMRDDFFLFPFVDHHGYSGIVFIHPPYHRLVFFIDEEDEGAERNIILTNPFVTPQCRGHAGISRRVRGRCNQRAGQQGDDASAKVSVQNLHCRVRRPCRLEECCLL